MIDTAIEKYLKDIILDAYPAVREENIYFNYPRADFEMGIGLSGKPSRVIGTESLDVQMHVDQNEKMDRALLIKKLVKDRSLTLDNKVVRMVFKQTIQKDFIKITNLQGAVFVFNFRYEITEE